MATHSSIVAWKIPWREEPGGLQSMGSHRVGHARTRTHIDNIIGPVMNECQTDKYKRKNS